ncbi:iron-siderophore ABC transporter substrate-binding protein, partial [Rhodococcus sp. CC-R104]|nr:iron-siderophore ABC transporter substrate-binding protein [Rhodococcus sp. CC-R104]
MKLRIAAVVAATALAVAACGSNGTDTVDDAESTGTGAFPATVDTMFGEVTIESRPERVAALGWGDADTALALGVEPVAAGDWLGCGGDGVGPWARGRYSRPPELIDTVEPS